MYRCIDIFTLIHYKLQIYNASKYCVWSIYILNLYVKLGESNFVLNYVILI